MTEIGRYLRFSLPDRIEHWILTLGFTTLAITGLVQKYATGSLSQWAIQALGGIESVRLIHRYAAILLMLEVVYHVGVVLYRVFVRRVQLTMLPGIEDVRLAIHALQHNIGLRADRPLQGRYTFEEKAEYWAVVWGTLIMVVTGFILWNPIATARFLPGDFIPAAKAAHGAEALLASLAIIVWHLYGVHVKFFNRSMFTGHLNEEEMLEEHPLELAEVKAGVAERPVDPPVLQRRRRSFLGLYGVVTAVSLLGIYWFVTFEESAITTVSPAEQVVIFAPLTATPLPTLLPTATARPTPTPTPTPLPGEPTAVPSELTAIPETLITWSDVTDLFQQKCGTCHSDATALGDLNLASYDAALAAVQPGDPDASTLVTLQAQGGHPGQFSDDELERVRQWIADGALEDATSEPEPEARITWQDVSEPFQRMCGSCHSSAAKLGGLDLSSYDAALAAVEPGNPDASSLVTLQAQGGHPGQLSPEELELVQQWIEDGAQEE